MSSTEIEEDFIFPVYIYRETLQKIISLTRSFENEIFGYLIGSILKWNEKIYIIIEEELFLLGATHSEKLFTYHIEGTTGKYEKKVQRMRKRTNNPSLRVLGWFHSHPDLGCFLSKTDLITQQFCFPESYQVALVVDPFRDELEFFTLDKNSENGYKSISYAILAKI